MNSGKDFKGSESPLITLCVATFESGKFIERTLQSLANQTYGKFRCIVSDDASSDGTVARCESIALKDPRFVVQTHQERKGWIGNVNRILEQDLGEYFMIISHDDQLHPQCLELLISALQSNPAASVAFSDVEEIMPSSQEDEVHAFDSASGATSFLKRVVPVVIGKGKWWLPYHGLVRSSSLKFERRLRRNLAGEFQADLVWVIGLSISGDFVRVPRTLWQKNRMVGSVASQWRYTLLQAAALSLSCTRFVLGSKVSWVDRLRILPFIPYGYLRILRWKLICLLKR